ncbi:hypothetical protein DB41_EC00120 [Neochlamydia sp. TUME1]|uniref:hypothetical protein n=1 Tax=Neochlamydia sp. TUME1 TaxID=1478174 RepID=UPI00057FD476|nr:hypothetical protein [Neochlamydia sp. TUME1]KIC76864.1 hypothetical protein DB41_EC00120 [Neochlamydia sp. TUME1]
MRLLKPLIEPQIKGMHSSLVGNLFACLLLELEEPTNSPKGEGLATLAFIKREIKTLAGTFSCRMD